MRIHKQTEFKNPYKPNFWLFGNVTSPDPAPTKSIWTLFPGTVSVPQLLQRNRGAICPVYYPSEDEVMYSTLIQPKWLKMSNTRLSEEVYKLALGRTDIAGIIYHKRMYREFYREAVGLCAMWTAHLNNRLYTIEVEDKVFENIYDLDEFAKMYPNEEIELK